MNRPIIILISISWFIGFTGCSENPRIQFVEHADKTAVVQFNAGAFIDKVDLDKVMKDYCDSLKPKIIREDETQLPGQYKFQKKVEFIRVSP